MRRTRPASVSARSTSYTAWCETAASVGPHRADDARRCRRAGASCTAPSTASRGRVTRSEALAQHPLELGGGRHGPEYAACSGTDQDCTVAPCTSKSHLSAFRRSLKPERWDFGEAGRGRVRREGRGAIIGRCRNRPGPRPRRSPTRPPRPGPPGEPSSGPTPTSSCCSVPPATSRGASCCPGWRTSATPSWRRTSGWSAPRWRR